MPQNQRVKTLSALAELMKQAPEMVVQRKPAPSHPKHSKKAEIPKAVLTRNPDLGDDRDADFVPRFSSTGTATGRLSANDPATSNGPRSGSESWARPRARRLQELPAVGTEDFFRANLEVLLVILRGLDEDRLVQDARQKPVHSSEGVSGRGHILHWFMLSAHYQRYNVVLKGLASEQVFGINLMKIPVVDMSYRRALIEIVKARLNLTEPEAPVWGADEYEATEAEKAAAEAKAIADFNAIKDTEIAERDSGLPTGMATFLIEQCEARIPKSLWFEAADILVYLRAGPACSYQNLGEVRLTVPAVVISNVTATKCRVGIFTDFVAHLKSLAKRLGYTELQIENALSPDMQAWCMKHGFALRSHSQDPCYYLALPKEMEGQL